MPRDFEIFPDSPPALAEKCYAGRAGILQPLAVVSGFLQALFKGGEHYNGVKDNCLLWGNGQEFPISNRHIRYNFRIFDSADEEAQYCIGGALNFPLTLRERQICLVTRRVKKGGRECATLKGGDTFGMRSPDKFWLRRGRRWVIWELATIAKCKRIFNSGPSASEAPDFCD